MPDLDVRQAVEPVTRRLRSWMDRLPPGPARVVARLLDRQVLLAGSSLAFYALVSALPLTLLSLTLADDLFGPEAVRQVSQQLTASEARGAGRMLMDVSSAAQSPSWVIYAFVLWPATAYGGGLRRAFMEANGDRETLPGLKGRAIGLLLVLVLPVVLIGGIPLTFVLTRLAGDGLAGTLVGVALAVVGGAVTGTLLNTLLYHAFTSEDLGWRRTVPTAALVATLTALMSLGFVVYLRFADLEQRYGSEVLATVLLLGVWMLAVNVLLLAGYHAIVEYERADEDAG